MPLRPSSSLLCVEQLIQMVIADYYFKAALCHFVPGVCLRSRKSFRRILFYVSAGLIGLFSCVASRANNLTPVRTALVRYAAAANSFKESKEYKLLVLMRRDATTPFAFGARAHSLRCVVGGLLGLIRRI